MGGACCGNTTKEGGVSIDILYSQECQTEKNPSKNSTRAILDLDSY